MKQELKSHFKNREIIELRKLDKLDKIQDVKLCIDSVTNEINLLTKELVGLRKYRSDLRTLRSHRMRNLGI